MEVRDETLLAMNRPLNANGVSDLSPGSESPADAGDRPWGSKISHLADIARQHAYEVDSVDYRGISDPDDRVTHLIETLENESGVILVGSSMGGYVSLVAAEQVDVDAIFLMAPALYIPDYAKQEYTACMQPIEIVHGWSDDIIPPEYSIRFAAKGTMRCRSGISKRLRRSARS